MTLSPSSTCIVPLYLYPLTRDTWDPLYKAISRHPLLNFIIVVNPNSGPGVDPDGWYPTKHYVKEIPRLNNYKNVITIGYIRLNYGQRPIDEVEDDIRKYANWTTYSVCTEQGHRYPDQGMRGIFLDEVPNIYSDEAAAYLDSVDRLVKDTEGILGDQLIVHNPGTVPDIEYAMYWNPKQSQVFQNGHDDRGEATMEEAEQGRVANDLTSRHGPDITIIFEESYKTWRDSKVQKRLNELLRYERAACCFIVHSVPPDTLTDLIHELRERGGCIFVTVLSERFYESFGDSWVETIDTIASISEPVDDSDDSESVGEDQ